MGRLRTLATGSICTLALVAASPPALRAASDQNEVAALLVFPAVLTETFPGSGEPVETYLAVTNSAPGDYEANLFFIDGTSCGSCGFDFALAGERSERLVVFRQGSTTVIRNLRTNAEVSCAGANGFVVLTLSAFGDVVADNVLFGEQTVIDASSGSSYSMRALALQGQNGGDGDLELAFNGIEYGQFPAVLAAEFVAPNVTPGTLDTFLALFTPGFADGAPPFTMCQVTGFDANANAFSRSFNFGCWTFRSLVDVSPEFAYPNLGQTAGANDEQGWLILNCDVTPSGGTEAQGGVHGAMIQVTEAGAILNRENPSAPALAAPAAWGRLLEQSVTVGGNVTLELE